MDDNVQNGLQSEQWLPMFEKGEKRTSSLGSGAFRFIRTRSSIRRELKRQCSRGKNGDSAMVHEAGTGSSGGGLGKWLREHLGGGSKGGQDGGGSPKATNGGGSMLDPAGSEKPFAKTVYASQNLYCSLPREHSSRHAYGGGRKPGHGSSAKAQGHDRQRCASASHREKPTLTDLGATLTRGGPVYGSEGKSPRRRNRDRRRHSLNESHEQSRQRRKSCSPTFGRHVPHTRFAGACQRHSVHGIRPRVHLVVADMASQHPRRRTASFGVNLRGDEDEAETYKFEVSPTEEDIDAFIRGLLEDEEEEHEGEEDEYEKSPDELSDWGALPTRPDHAEKYYGEEEGEEHLGEAEGEGEGMPLSSTISTVEKFEEEEIPLPEEEFESAVPEIPAEVLAEREAHIGKIKELQSELSDLKRKNKLLELWVSRHMKKTQQRMTPSDPSKTAEQMEEVYREALREYKMQVDEILTQQSELTFELKSYTQKVNNAQTEDDRVFQEFLEREKEVSIGLVFAQTGKRITDKLMNALARRQMIRREILARDRHSYIMLQHRLDDLNARLKIAETLGEGMTAMDYEALHVANVSYKDRLDERDQELEKLRIKIAETVNGVAQYKEKEVCIVEDIDFEQQNLQDYCEANIRARERLNRVHVELNEVRDAINEKRQEAGLLVARQELIEMEKMMNKRDELIGNIEAIEAEIQHYQEARQSMKAFRPSKVSFA